MEKNTVESGGIEEPEIHSDFSSGGEPAETNMEELMANIDLEDKVIQSLLSIKSTGYLFGGFLDHLFSKPGLSLYKYKDACILTGVFHTGDIKDIIEEYNIKRSQCYDLVHLVKKNVNKLL